MKTIGTKILCAWSVALIGAMTLAANAQTVIYSDNFDIPNTANFDTSAQAGRHSGLVQNVAGRSGGIVLSITSSNLNLLNAGANDGRMRLVDTNNTAGRWDWASGAGGAAITGSNGMRISFDWTAIDNNAPASGTNWMSFSTGILPNTDQTFRTMSPSTDSGIRFANNGVVQVFKNGVGGAIGTFDVSSLSRHVDLDYSFGSFADGGNVALQAYVNGVRVAGQVFVWNSNGGSNNMEMSSLVAGTRIDNFTIATVPQALNVGVVADAPVTNYVGRTITLSGLVSGAVPVTNQWQVNTGSGFTNIPGATGSSLILNNAQVGNSGIYSLVVSNALGWTNGSLGVVMVAAPITNLIDVQFTGETPGAGGFEAPTQSGAAVIGSATDVWNAIFTSVGSYTAGTAATCTNTAPIFLKSVDGIGTPVSMKFVADYIHRGGAGGFAAGAVANLMNGVLAVQSSRTGTVTLSNVPAGTYDLYLYGVNNGATNRSSTFTANGVSAVCGPNGAATTLASPTNYVRLLPVVTANGVLTITMVAATGGDAQLNGFQLSGPQLAPSLLLSSDTTVNSKTTTVYAGNNVTFSASFSGTQPITNQWMVDKGSGFVSITSATNSTLILTNVQVSDSGSYALYVTNAAGFSNSTPLVFTVLPLPTNLTVNVQFTGSGFGSGNAPAQTGEAVIGLSGDIWNTVSNPNGDGNSPSGRANATNLNVVDVTNITTAIRMDYVADYLFNGRAFGASGPFFDNGSQFASLMTGYMGSVTTTNGGSHADTNTIVLRNVTPGSYDLYLYSSGRNDGQGRISVFTANGVTGVCGPNSSNIVLTAGANYVHLTPTVAIDGLLTISFYGTVDAGQALLNGFQLNGPVTLPTLFLSSDTTSDSPKTNYVGRSVSLTAGFGGNPTPKLQWKVDRGSGFTNVSAIATNATLTFNNVNVSDTGIYSLFATNVVGLSNSTPFSLTVFPTPSTNLAVNIQFDGTSFGSGHATRQTGPAVIGNTGDEWNVQSNPHPTGGGDTTPVSGTGLTLTDIQGIGTTVTLTYSGNTILNSGTGTPFNGSGSPAENLMQAALGASGTNTATVSLQGLTNGLYELYLYSSAGNGGGQSHVTRFTANSASATVGPNSGNNVLTLNGNYVHFASIVSNGTLNISFVSTNGTGAELNGMQIFGPSEIPTLFTTADTALNSPNTVYAGRTVTFTAAFDGTQPITNQWRVDTGGGFVNVPGATSTTLVLNNVTTAATGTYSLFASNAAGSTNSTPIMLTVLAAPANNGIGVNVQFTGNALGSGDAPTYSGAAAIGSPGDFWNAVSNPNGNAVTAGASTGSGLALSDVLGNSTIMTFDYVGDYDYNGAAFGGSTPFIDAGSPYANLFQGYLGLVNNHVGTLTIRNLAPGAYDLYLYSLAGNGAGPQSRFATITANGASATVGPNNANTNLIQGVNYIRLTSTVTANGLLTMTYSGTADGGQSQLDGFQLTGPGAVVQTVNVGTSWDGSQLTLTWTQGTLQQTTNLVTGPWINTAGATPPSFTITPSATDPQIFYRVRVQ